MGFTRFATVLCAVAASFALAGCGGGGSSSTTIRTLAAHRMDTKHVAVAIERSILAQRHIHARVTCPSNVPRRAGWHFVCFANTAAGQTPFVVTEVNGAGYVTYVGR
jgi:hypothetical protein